MAEEALDETTEAEEGSGGKGRSKPLLLIIVILILVIAGGGAWYFLGAGDSGSEIAGEADEGEDVEEEEEAKPVTPYYFTLNPPFVVNFAGTGRARFLQVNIEGLTRDPSVKEDVTMHMPHIRNNIVFILSSQRYEDLVSAEGKEKLRKQILDEIRSILKQETGNSDIEDIYFTSFVIQ